LEKIFLVFQRAHLDLEGTGIDLSIVKRAIEKMGGSVGVESIVDKGSTFWIELPAG
jgi:signal transduction histidine kinase